MEVIPHREICVCTTMVVGQSRTRNLVYKLFYDYSRQFKTKASPV